MRPWKPKGQIAPPESKNIPTCNPFGEVLILHKEGHHLRGPSYVTYARVGLMETESSRTIHQPTKTY